MPLLFCKDCKKWDSCKEICKKVKQELRKVTKGRPKWETLVNPQVIDKIRYNKERGRQVRPRIYDDNWEEVRE